MSQRQILIAEIDPSYIPRITKIAISLGHTVLSAVTCHDLKNCLDNQKVDLVLFDPTSLGTEELAEAVNALAIHEVPAVFLVDHVYASVGSSVNESLIFDSIVKPFADLELSTIMAMTLLRHCHYQLAKAHDALVVSEAKYEQMNDVWEAITQYQLEPSYTQLFMSIPTGFILLEVIADSENNPVDYRYLRLNPAAEYLFGVRTVDVIGRTMLEVLSEAECVVWIDHLNQLTQTGVSREFTIFVPMTDRYLSNTIYCPQVGQIALVTYDITELKKTTEQLQNSITSIKELADESELANRVKSQFLANMSHEIRTPLKSIVGMLQLLELTNLDEEQANCVQLAIKSSNRLTDLVSIYRILDNYLRT